MDWEGLREHTYSLPESTLLDKACVDILYEISIADDLPPGTAGAYHHLLPLSCFGAVEDDSNYKYCSTLGHIKAHAALAHRFRYIMSLQRALANMINLNKGDIPEETVWACLRGVVSHWNLMASVVLIDC
jgi:hypothetical protein